MIPKEKRVELLEQILVSAEEQEYLAITNGGIAQEIGNVKSAEASQKNAVDIRRSIDILKKKIEDTKKE